MANLKDIYNKQLKEQEKTIKRKNTTKKVSSLIIVVLLLAALGIGGFFILNNIEKSNKLVLDKTYGNYTAINVKGNSSVDIYGVDEQEITIIYHDKRTNGDYTITNDGGIVNIISSSNKHHDKLEIHIPYDYVLDINITVTEGDVNIEDMFINNLNVDVENGSVEVNYVDINYSSIIKTINGSVEIVDSNIKDNITIQTENGIVETNNVDMSGLNNIIKTLNGRVEILDTFARSLDVDTENGDIEVQLYYDGKKETNQYHVTAKSTNGNVKQQKNNESNQIYEIKLNSKNGNIIVSFLDN